MCRHIPVFISSSLLTIIKESLHVNKYIWEGGELLLILEKLSEIVSNGLCVVVLWVSHPHSVVGLLTVSWLPVHSPVSVCGLSVPGGDCLPVSLGAPRQPGLTRHNKCKDGSQSHCLLRAVPQLPHCHSQPDQCQPHVLMVQRGAGEGLVDMEERGEVGDCWDTRPRYGHQPQPAPVAVDCACPGRACLYLVSAHTPLYLTSSHFCAQNCKNETLAAPQDWRWDTQSRDLKWKERFTC